jgi:flagellar biogenesis protein FliO
MTDVTSFDLLGRLLPSLALIVGALLLVRRWARRSAGVGSGHALQVLARTGLTRGAVLVIVAVGARRFLVGATDHGVALLSELEEGEGGEFAPLTNPGVDAAGGLVPSRATDRRAAVTSRPWMGLVDRLRAMTVRTHPERPTRAHHG